MQNDNPFKKIGRPSRKVPIDLKNKVMSDMASAKLMSDIANLFTSNYKSAFGSVLKPKRK
jgi:hypothetical protein